MVVAGDVTPQGPLSLLGIIRLPYSITIYLEPYLCVLQLCRDLIHPHHDNEIAQSQAACCDCDGQFIEQPEDFVRLWMHLGFVNGASAYLHDYSANAQLQA